MLLQNNQWPNHTQLSIFLNAPITFDFDTFLLALCYLKDGYGWSMMRQDGVLRLLAPIEVDAGLGVGNSKFILSKGKQEMAQQDEKGEPRSHRPRGADRPPNDLMGHHSRGLET